MTSRQLLREIDGHLEDARRLLAELGGQESGAGKAACRMLYAQLAAAIQSAEQAKAVLFPPDGEAPAKPKPKKIGVREHEAEEMLAACQFPQELHDEVAKWLAYKAERKEQYAPTGLQSLLARIKNSAGEYGPEAVADVISASMAANYQGIVFDRIKERAPKNKQSPRPSARGESDLEKQILARFMEGSL